MLELQGIAVSPGVAIGKVLILDREGYRITRSQIDSADRHNELDRLRTAIAEASKRLEQHRRDSTEKIGVDIGAIFSAHQQLLWIRPIEWERLISDSCYKPNLRSRRCSAAMHAFRNMGSDVMAERAATFATSNGRCSKRGGAPLQVSGWPGAIDPAQSRFDPAETAGLDRSKIIGFCTEAGGPGGHTAIVARGMELPAVVGLGSFLHRIARETTVIPDGFSGRVVLQPRRSGLERLSPANGVRAGRVKQLTEIRDLPAVTQDGTRVTLLANIEFPGEIAASLQRGAEGMDCIELSLLLGCGHRAKRGRANHRLS
ncbi:MAG: PEP-utilizing enzyme [Pirellulaceae bacterium]